MHEITLIKIAIYENRECSQVSSIGKVLFFDLFELSQQHNFCSFDNPYIFSNYIRKQNYV